MADYNLEKNLETLKNLSVLSAICDSSFIMVFIIITELVPTKNSAKNIGKTHRKKMTAGIDFLKKVY